MATFTLNRLGLFQTLQAPNSPVAQYLDLTANRVKVRAQGHIASQIHRTGALASSIKVTTGRDSELYADVGSDLPYAAAQELGAKPHIIRPRPGGALFFHWERFGVDTLVPHTPGRTYYNRRRGVFVIGKGRVDHPGNPAVRYLYQAADEIIRSAP